MGGEGWMEGRVEIRGTALLSVTIQGLGIKRPFSSLFSPRTFATFLSPPYPRATHFPSSLSPHPSCVVSSSFRFLAARHAAPFLFRDRKPARHEDASTFSTSKEQAITRRRAITILAYVSSPEILEKRVFFPSLSPSYLLSRNSFVASILFSSTSRIPLDPEPSLLLLQRKPLEMIEKRKRRKSVRICFRNEMKRSLASFFPLIAFHSLLIGGAFSLFSITRSVSSVGKKERDLRTRSFPRRDG